MEYIKKVKLEIDREHLNSISVIQNDTARSILFYLHENGSNYSLSGRTVRVWGIKPDGSKIFADLSIINASGGVCKLKLTNNMLAVVGELRLMLTVTEGIDILSTIPLVINISKTLRDNAAVESTNEFSALDTALSSVQEWDNYFRETSGLIEQRYTTRLNNLEKNITRKFTPALGIAQWWIRKNSNTNRWESKADSEIKADIDRFAAMGIEEMTLCIHCSFDNSTREWYMIHSGAVALMAYNYCISKGIRPNSLKFMIYDAKEVAVNNFSTFKSFIQTKINAFCTYLGQQNCEFDVVTVLNELPSIYKNSANASAVNELLAVPRSSNYKASLSLTNTLEYYQLPQSVRDNLNIICVNLYPNVSYNGSAATLEESIRAWDRYVLDLKGIKQREPNKDIIITETGCQDRWEALANTGAYNWVNDYPNTSKGKAPALFLKGLFESDMKYLVKSINYWYYDALYDSSTGRAYKDVDNVIREYITSINNNNPVYNDNTIEYIGAEDGVITFNRDGNYYTNMANETTIKLPTTTPSYMEIRLWFKCNEDLTIIFPNINYQYEPEAYAGYTYEYIFTFVNNEWNGGFVTYETTANGELIEVNRE